MKTITSNIHTTIIMASSLVCSLRAEPPTPSQLAGSYYRGDHLGYNLILDLAPAGTYIATWSGCLGTYGTGKGRWTTKAEQVVLTPSAETGTMKGHLRQLRVIPKGKGFVLVPPSDLKDSYYKKYGPTETIAFHKQPKKP